MQTTNNDNTRNRTHNQWDISVRDLLTVMSSYPPSLAIVAFLFGPDIPHLWDRLESFMMMRESWACSPRYPSQTCKERERAGERGRERERKLMLGECVIQYKSTSVACQLLSAKCITPNCTILRSLYLVTCDSPHRDILCLC